MPEMEAILPDVYADLQQDAADLARDVSKRTRKEVQKDDFVDKPEPELKSLASEIATRTPKIKESVRTAAKKARKDLRSENLDKVVREEIDTMLGDTFIAETIEDTRSQITTVLASSLEQMQAAEKEEDKRGLARETKDLLQNLNNEISTEFVETVAFNFDEQLAEGPQEFVDTGVETFDITEVKPEHRILVEIFTEGVFYDERANKLLAFWEMRGSPERQMNDETLRFLHDLLHPNNNVFLKFQEHAEQLDGQIEAETDPEKKSELKQRKEKLTRQKNLYTGLLLLSRQILEEVKADPNLRLRFALLNQTRTEQEDLSDFPFQDFDVEAVKKQEAFIAARLKKKQSETISSSAEWEKLKPLQEKIRNGEVEFASRQMNEIIAFWRALEAEQPLPKLSDETMQFLHDFLQGSDKRTGETMRILQQMERQAIRSGRTQDIEDLRGGRATTVANTVLLKLAEQVNEAMLNPARPEMREYGDRYLAINEDRAVVEVSPVQFAKDQKIGAFAEVINKPGGVVNTFLFKISKLWAGFVAVANGLIFLQDRKNTGALTYAIAAGGGIYLLDRNEHWLKPGDPVENYMETNEGKREVVTLRRLLDHDPNGAEKEMLMSINFRNPDVGKFRQEIKKGMPDRKQKWGAEQEKEYLQRIGESDVVNGSTDKKQYQAALEKMERNSDYFLPTQIELRKNAWNVLRTSGFNQHQMRDLLSRL